MAEKQYDLVVLGGGTAGYVAAIRAAQLGKQVAIVEQGLLGGTCLHKGCIPTKALLKSAEVAHTIQQSDDFGISTEGLKINFNQVQARKNNIVKQMFDGVNHLMTQNSVDVFNGMGRILGPSIFSPQSGTISVEYADGESELIPNNHVLIATGSTPMALPFLPFDHQTILSSDDILEIDALPESLAIIGGGVIGLEFASLMTDFGVKVSVIEAGKRILPTESKRVAQTVKKALASRGVQFYEGVALSEEHVEVKTSQAVLTLNDQPETFDKVLVAIGRTPNTEDLGLNNTKIKTTERGHIITNAFQQTEDKHIYAAGDCVGGLQLAHVGSKEGTIAVEHMFEQNPIALDANKVPRCIYTNPEVASIGINAEQAKADNIKVKSQKVTFRAIGKAMIEDYETQTGFAEMTVDADTNEVLGVSLIGPHVTELINEMALLQFMDGSALELGLTTHAHPSLSEILMELGLKAEGRAIHA